MKKNNVDSSIEQSCCDFGQPIAAPSVLEDISLNKHNEIIEESFGNPAGNNSALYDSPCCANCRNNPKNNPNATGICYCSLPAMTQIRY